MKLGDDLPKGWILIKGAAFLILGLLSSGLLLVLHPDLRTFALLAIAIWAFCRLYYFCFYVIEHYVDPEFRFSGLGSFLSWMFKRNRVGEHDQSS